MYNRFFILIFWSLLLSGCTSLSYYGQAISGHLSLMAKRQPIGQLLEQDDVDPVLRERLRLVQSIRDFASRSLQLPDNGSYRSFVEINGEAVVWSLVATEAYSVDPKQWCYPVIGCASYRGYFDLEMARREAERLSEQRLDVALEPVPAYSTLGWFDDPLPGTVIEWSDWRLAGLIFHELAHQRLYIPDDSAFNEAFANTVQRMGVALWLNATRSGERLQDWQRAQRRENEFVQLLLQTREHLGALYLSAIDEAEMERGKRALFDELVVDYQRLKRTWAGFDGYDAWFERGLNNARLASVATYEAWVPAFELLFKRENSDYSAFYQACERMKLLSAEERLAQMQQLREAARSDRTGIVARPVTNSLLSESGASSLPY